MKTVSLIGDSHSQITFPYLADMLKSTVKYKVIQQESRAGWSAKKFLSDGVVGRLTRNNPDLTIFSLGGNNHDLNSDSYYSTLMSLLDSRGGRFMWVSPTYSIRDDVEKRHRWTHQFLDSFLPDRKYIDIRTETSTGHKSDNVHYTRSQYKIIADKIFHDILKKDRTSGMIAFLLLAGIGIGILKKKKVI